MTYHFKLLTLAKHKIGAVYSNIVVSLGPKYEMSSSAGGMTLYGVSFNSTRTKEDNEHVHTGSEGVTTLRPLDPSATSLPQHHNLPFNVGQSPGE